MVTMPSSFSWPETLTSVIDRRDLTLGEAREAMLQVMAGTTTDAQLGAFLVALRAKGETVEEIAGFREAVLENAVGLNLPSLVLDIVGTGGDPFGAVVNVSSIASIVAAAAGIPVVKHGNRAASSASGASDVLTALGVNLEGDPSVVTRVFEEVGLTFVFAAHFHPGFRHAAAARKELGIPTVFNILGPLCNPARPEASAVGVSDATRVHQVAGVFQTRGATALVYRGEDGIDKMTTTGNSLVVEVSSGQMREHTINAQDLGLAKATPQDLLGTSPEHNAELARGVLAGDRGPVRDIIVLNAAAGMVAFDLAQDPAEATTPLRQRLLTKIALAEATLDSGAAADKLDAWSAATHRSV